MNILNIIKRFKYIYFSFTILFIISSIYLVSNEKKINNQVYSYEIEMSLNETGIDDFILEKIKYQIIYELYFSSMDSRIISNLQVYNNKPNVINADSEKLSQLHIIKSIEDDKFNNLINDHCLNYNKSMHNENIKIICNTGTNNSFSEIPNVKKFSQEVNYYINNYLKKEIIYDTKYLYEEAKALSQYAKQLSSTNDNYNRILTLLDDISKIKAEDINLIVDKYFFVKTSIFENNISLKEFNLIKNLFIVFILYLVLFISITFIILFLQKKNN